jgi:hypothetical protein
MRNFGTLSCPAKAGIQHAATSRFAVIASKYWIACPSAQVRARRAMTPE